MAKVSSPSSVMSNSNRKTRKNSIREPPVADLSDSQDPGAAPYIFSVSCGDVSNLVGLDGSMISFSGNLL